MPAQTAEQEADDRDMMEKVGKVLSAAPSLRPRMFTVLDRSGVLRRINLAHVVQWWVTPKNGIDNAYVVLLLERGEAVQVTDPDGQVDNALCAAFFDCTQASLT